MDRVIETDRQLSSRTRPRNAESEVENARILGAVPKKRETHESSRTRRPDARQCNGSVRRRVSRRNGKKRAGGISVGTITRLILSPDGGRAHYKHISRGLGYKLGFGILGSFSADAFE